MNQTNKIAFNIIMAFLFILGFSCAVNAGEPKLFISNNKLNYQCPDGVINPPASLNVDLASVKILNDSYFTDKNNVYVVTEDWHGHTCAFNIIAGADPATFKFFNAIYQKDKNNPFYNTSYWGWGIPSAIKFNSDAVSFTALGGGYAKDINNVYFVPNKGVSATIALVTGADPASFEIFKEDNEYAMDKNNMYFQGNVLAKQNLKITNSNLYNGLKGKIILKAESNGEAYYINPNKKEMYSLSRPVIAFRVMREQGIGISDENLEKIPVGGNCPAYFKNCDIQGNHNLKFANSQKGKILFAAAESPVRGFCR